MSVPEYEYREESVVLQSNIEISASPEDIARGIETQRLAVNIVWEILEHHNLDDEFIKELFHDMSKENRDKFVSIAKEYLKNEQ